MDPLDRRLLEAIQQGLPLTARPYAAIAAQLGMREGEVIERLERLRRQGLIKRLGVVLRHRPLGYSANAMIVLDVPDRLVAQIGGHISRFSFVSLCYRRPRCGEQWPYNLYCMIHGKSRGRVLQQLEQLSESCGLGTFPREVLFSRRCFKQRGALYRASLVRGHADG